MVTRTIGFLIAFLPALASVFLDSRISNKTSFFLGSAITCLLAGICVARGRGVGAEKVIYRFIRGWLLGVVFFFLNLFAVVAFTPGCSFGDGSHW